MKKSFKSASGKYIAPRCVRNMRETRKTGKKTNEKIRCPRGYVIRAAYARRYTTAVRERGYTVKKASGTTYRVYPKNETLYVPAACIPGDSLPSEAQVEAQAQAPAKKGEITKFGYSVKDDESERRAALKKAVASLGVIPTYKKLDIVAKLSAKIVPDASRIFAKDRDWIEKTFGPLRV
jgi:hypothetical protein